MIFTRSMIWLFADEIAQPLKPKQSNANLGQTEEIRKLSWIRGLPVLMTFHCFNQLCDRAANDSLILWNTITLSLVSSQPPQASRGLCLHPLSSRASGVSLNSGPLISFMDAVNHSTHRGAGGKSDLWDLPAWFFQSKILTVNDFPSSYFFSFGFLICLSKIPM